MTDISTIGIIGAGLMGHGIALTFARAGHRVQVHDPFAESLETLHERVRTCLVGMGVETPEITVILERISTHDSLAAAVEGAGYITEAVPEKLELKQAIFAEAEAAASKDCILASNTSVIPITKIMSGLKDRSRAIGTHWWNPPHLIPLVEVIRTEWADDDVLDRAIDLLSAAGKQCVLVEKDIPGFVGNRLQHALWREAISLVENGICSAEDVDNVVKSSFGRRLAVLGPLENADLVGTDLTLDIHENVLFDLESRKHPLPYLRQLVEDGNLGMKSGQGFRKWTKQEAQEIRDLVAAHLKKLDGILDS